MRYQCNIKPEQSGDEDGYRWSDIKKILREKLGMGFAMVDWNLHGTRKILHVGNNPTVNVF